MASKSWDIRDCKGEVLYSASTRTFKECVQKAVADGADLSRADLRRADLKHLDLREARMSGALLDSASLKGARLDDADLSGASARGAFFGGASMRRCSLKAVDATDADMSSAIMTYADMTAVTLDGAFLVGVAASSSLLVSAHAKKADFSRADFTNADFGLARVVQCKFAGATVDSNGNLPSRRMPDRTRSGVIVGNDYSEAVLSENVPAMRFDRFVGKTNRTTALLSTVATVGLFGAKMESVATALGVTGTLTSTLGVGAGVGVGVVLSATFVTKELALDRLGAGVHEAVRGLQQGVSKSVASIWRETRQRADLVAAIFSSRDFKPFKAALETSAERMGNRGKAATVKSFFCDIGRVVVCQRRHLDAALEQLDVHGDPLRTLDRDVVVVRADDAEKPRQDVPAAVRFHVDGRVTAVWFDGSRPDRTASYAPDGTLEATYYHDTGTADTADPTPDGGTRDDMLRDFKTEALAASGLRDMDFDTRTHRLQYGLDGSVLILNKSTGRIDNPDGPAVRLPDGSRLAYQHGRKVGTATAPDENREFRAPTP